MSDIDIKTQEKVDALAQAGFFDIAEGKATVHFKDGVIQGVQVEQWAYKRQLSTGSSSAPRHIPV